MKGNKSASILREFHGLAVRVDDLRGHEVAVAVLVEDVALPQAREGAQLVHGGAQPREVERELGPAAYGPRCEKVLVKCEGR